MKQDYELKLGDGYKKVCYTTIFIYAYSFLFFIVFLINVFKN